MPTSDTISAMLEIDNRKREAIASISNTDPEYETKIQEIEKRSREEKYKSMKSLNSNNERIPERAKANMRRRSSLNPTQILSAINAKK